MKTNEFIEYLKRLQFSSSTLGTSERVIKIYFHWLEKERMEAEQVSY